MRRKFCVICFLLLTLLFVSCQTDKDDDSNDTHTCEFGEWQTITEATCTQKGEKKRTCSCGEEENQEISIQDHQYTEGNYCSNCFVMKVGTYTEGLVISNGTVTDVGTAINESEIIIPAYHEGKKVTSIAAKAFLGCKKTKSIVIPSTISDIGEGTFSGCSNLEEMTIPTIGHSEWGSVLTNYGYYVTPFGNYFGIDEYENSEWIKQTKKSYNSAAYTPLSEIEIVYYIPASLKTIKIIPCENEKEYGPILENFPIETIIIGSSVKTLKEASFEKCRELKTVIFEKNSSLEELGDDIFSFCEQLESIDIPNSVRTIPSQCFYHCRNLKEVNLPSSLEEIEMGAFLVCENLKTITLPITLKKIEISAFQTSGLVEITLPASLNTIEEDAFYNCTSLKTVYNKSRLSITKGNTSNGMVAYYAETVITE